MVEAEVVETDGIVPTEEAMDNQNESSDGNQATVLLNLEDLIKKHISSLDRLRNELKQNREMYDDTFINNETFRVNSEKAKEANKVKSQTRQSIANQPAVISLASKVKDLRMDIKERQSALSDYLQEYQRMTGATEIEGEDGQIREIVNNISLRKRSGE